MQMPSNPFVGLRPYESNESLLFFGQSAQMVSLLKKLHESRFLAVVGSSGSGKSSLIRAGLIPTLKGGFLVEKRDQWFMGIMKPGEEPLTRLARCLLHSISPEQEPTTEAIETLVENLRSKGKQAILEAIVPTLKKSGANFLLLVDQFEEIFRFRAQAQARESFEAELFVDILLRLVEQEVWPVYVVITMRSDFIGDCAAFHGLPEALNFSQHLVPRLTRQQRREVIEGPVRLFRRKIDPHLVSRLLNDLGETDDQLPVLQHTLMRTWDFHKDPATPIDMKAYIAAGKLSNALSQHANEAMIGMSDEDKWITKRLFQTLTELDNSNRGIRRPATIGEIMTACNTSMEKVLEIIELFRSDRRSFLIVTAHPPTKDTIIDISHESLIRQWDELRSWLQEEAVDGRRYMQIMEGAMREALGEGSLWQDPELNIALKWRKEKQPSVIWAARYHASEMIDVKLLEGAKKALADADKLKRNDRGRIICGDEELFEIVMSFLDRSSDRHLAIIAAEKEAQERELAQARQLAAAEKEKAEAQRQAAAAEWEKAREQQNSAKKQRRLAFILFILAFLAAIAGMYGLYFWDAARDAEADVLKREADLKDSQKDLKKSQLDLEQAYQILDSLYVQIAANQEELALSQDELERSEKALGKSQNDLRRNLEALREQQEELKRQREALEKNIELAKRLRLERVSTSLVSRSLSLQRYGQPETGAKLALWAYNFNTLIPDEDKEFNDQIYESLRSSLNSHTEDFDSLPSAGGPVTGSVNHRDWVRDVVYGPDGKMSASASGDGIVRLWDLRNDEQRPILLANIRNHRNSAVRALVFNRTGDALISVGEDGRVMMQGALDQILNEQMSEENAVQQRYVKGGKSFYFQTQKTPEEIQKILEENSREIIGENSSSGKPSPIWCVALSPNGKKLVVGGADRLLIYPDIVNNPQISHLLVDSRYENTNKEAVAGTLTRINAVSFNNTGDLLAAAVDTDSLIRIWDVSDDRFFTRGTPRGIDVAIRKQHKMADNDLPAGVRSIAFSPQLNTNGSHLLASGGWDRRIVLWEVNKTNSGDISLKALPPRLAGHTSAITDLAFSPDGATLASCGFDKSIRLWELNLIFHENADNKDPFSILLNEHSDWVWSVAFSPDGNHLISGGADRQLLSWISSLEVLSDKTKGIVGEKLDSTDWRKYVGEEFLDNSLKDRSDTTSNQNQNR